MPAIRYFFSPEAWMTVSNYLFILFGGGLVAGVLILLPEHISYKITRHDNVGKLIVLVLIASGVFALLPVIETLFQQYTVGSLISLVVFVALLFLLLRSRTTKKPVFERPVTVAHSDN